MRMGVCLVKVEEAFAQTVVMKNVSLGKILVVVLLTVKHKISLYLPTFPGTNPVPEPTTLGLLALGATGLLASRRRK